MGKNTKKAPKVTSAPGANAETTQQVTNAMEQMGLANMPTSAREAYLKGMDPNHTVDLMKMIHTRFYEDKEAATAKFGEAVVEQMNDLNAVSMVTAMVLEVKYAQNPFAMQIRENHLPMIEKAAAAIGVTLNLEALPAPNAEGVVSVPSTAVVISPETNEEIDKEQATAEATAEAAKIDPTKIENESQLIAALQGIAYNAGAPVEKIEKIINFYQAYLKTKAHNSENSEVELKKVNEMSRTELFREAVTYVGESPFSLKGFIGHLGMSLVETHNPIMAFAMLKSIYKHQNSEVSDEQIADYVRIAVEWNTSSQISVMTRNIELIKKDIEVLSADKEKNKAALEDCERRINNLNKSIATYKQCLEWLSGDDVNIPKTIVEGWESKKCIKSANVVSTLLTAFYDRETSKCQARYDHDTLKYNIEQIAGHVLNLFRSANTAIADYSLQNLLPLTSEETPTEEKPAEEKPEEKKEKKSKK